MNLTQLTARVRSLVRDLSGNTFRTPDIYNFINEGIDRCIQVIPEFNGMAYLLEELDVPTFLPSHYHHLLAVYGAARCQEQDERFHQATKLMNEFELKLDALKADVLDGTQPITDADGNIVDLVGVEDYVRNVYFEPRYNDEEDIE